MKFKLIILSTIVCISFGCEQKKEDHAESEVLNSNVFRLNSEQSIFTWIVRKDGALRDGIFKIDSGYVQSKGERIQGLSFHATSILDSSFQFIADKNLLVQVLAFSPLDTSRNVSTNHREFSLPMSTHQAIAKLSFNEIEQEVSLPVKLEEKEAGFVLEGKLVLSPSVWKLPKDLELFIGFLIYADETFFETDKLSYQRDSLPL